MIALLEYRFCDMHIYEHYMIAEIHEGVNLSPKDNAFLVEIAETYYKEKPFVYLTHRVNSYSVNPAIYQKSSKIKNLVGFAVISKDYKAKSNAKVEKLFFNKPFEIFDELHEAIEWALSITKQH